MRKYVKTVFTAFQKPQFAHLLTEQPWFALPTETCRFILGSFIASNIHAALFVCQLRHIGGKNHQN